MPRLTLTVAKFVLKPTNIKNKPSKKYRICCGIGRAFILCFTLWERSRKHEERKSS